MPPPSRLSAAVFLSALLALPVCHRPATTAPPHLETVAVTSHLEGITAPCGCTSRPLGGLDRIAHAIETDKLPWLLVGNTFMTERAPTAAMTGYVRTTAQIVARIVARLRPAAIARGPWDVGPMAAALTALTQAEREQLFVGAVPGIAGTPQALLPRAGRLLQLAGLPLGILEGPPMPPEVAAVPQGTSKANSIAFAAQDTGTAAAAARLGGGTFDVATLNHEAQRLRQQGAVGVLLLWPHGTDQARALLGGLEGVDVVLAGSEEAPKAAETLGSAVLLDGGARGEYLGRLTVHRGAPGPLSYFDGGKRERDDAQAQHARYLREAERLPEGPGKQARLQRAATLAAAMASLETSPPAHSYVTWDLLPMDQHLPQAPWATEALAGYNKALCDSALADTAARLCAPAADAASVYVGNATCQACHLEAFAVWSQTAHSRAWATLEQADKTCDLSCVGCHVVGFERPGGFCHLADAEPFHNVGCESCHGPGLGHVQNPNRPEAWGATFVRNTPETTCRGCHNSQHSDQFNFNSYRPQVLGPGHGAPL